MGSLEKSGKSRVSQMGNIDEWSLKLFYSKQIFKKMIYLFNFLDKKLKLFDNLFINLFNKIILII
jgi:hypothetical protein